MNIEELIKPICSKNTDRILAITILGNKKFIKSDSK